MSKLRKVMTNSALNLYGSSLYGLRQKRREASRRIKASRWCHTMAKQGLPSRRWFSRKYTGGGVATNWSPHAQRGWWRGGVVAGRVGVPLSATRLDGAGAEQDEGEGGETPCHREYHAAVVVYSLPFGSMRFSKRKKQRLLHGGKNPSHAEVYGQRERPQNVNDELVCEAPDLKRVLVHQEVHVAGLKQTTR